MAKTLEQLPLCQDTDNFPTDEELHKATSQRNNTTAGPLGIRAKIFKALVTEEETFSIMRKIVHEFWTNKQQPTEFDIGHLGILPKREIY
eukprot:10408803-Ditylum_brightwellii.AAC.1